MSEPAAALLLLLASLMIGILGMVQLVRNWSRESTMAGRTAAVAAGRSEGVLGRLDVRLRRSRPGRDLLDRLTGAGVRMRVVDFVLLAGGLGLFGYLASELVLPTWLALLLGLGAARLAWMWLERKRDRRREEFVAQLPEVARLLSNSAAAGLSIRTAVEMAAGELDDPARAEMARVAQELRIGQSVEGALANLERRMPSREVGVLISTLVIQQRAGGDLVRALQDMAQALEARRDLRREIRTMLAGATYSGYLVGIVGVGMLLVVNLVSPGAIESITGSVIGVVAFGVAAALYVTGYLLIRRVTRIEV